MKNRKKKMGAFNVYERIINHIRMKKVFLKILICTDYIIKIFTKNRKIEMEKKSEDQSIFVESCVNICYYNI